MTWWPVTTKFQKVSFVKTAKRLFFNGKGFINTNSG